MKSFYIRAKGVVKLQITVNDHKVHFCKLYGEHNQCSLEIMSNDYLLVM